MSEHTSDDAVAVLPKFCKESQVFLIRTPGWRDPQEHVCAWTGRQPVLQMHVSNAPCCCVTTDFSSYKYPVNTSQRHVKSLLDSGISGTMRTFNKTQGCSILYFTSSRALRCQRQRSFGEQGGLWPGYKLLFKNDVAKYKELENPRRRAIAACFKQRSISI